MQMRSKLFVPATRADFLKKRYEAKRTRYHLTLKTLSLSTENLKRVKI